MTMQASPLSQAVEETTAEQSQTASLTKKTIEQKTPARKKSAGAFRTISEVADELDVQQHVLRFWETKFSQIRPLKRGGGRRYYRPEDVDLLRTIHKLLYGEGYTIKGVQKLFREKGKNQVVEKLPAPGNTNQAPAVTAKAGFSERQRLALQSIAGDLRDLRNLLANDG
jgi:DNA-binding transcriptional MerR regulator